MTSENFGSSNLYEKGPHSHRETPEELKLAGNSPVINVFLPDNVLVLKPEQHEAASEALRTLAAEHPDVFKSLSGQTLDEARKIVAPYMEKTRHAA